MRADIHDGREHMRSKQRPDTLMQDRSPPGRRNLLATHGRTIHWVTSVALCNSRRPVDFRYAPLATGDAWRCNMSRWAMNRLMQRNRLRLFDHPIRTGDQTCRNFEAKLLRRLEVDDQLPMAFLKKRHLCWLAVIENFNNLRSETPISRLEIKGVGHQCSGLDRVTKTADG